MNCFELKSARYLAQDAIRQVVLPGDSAVDATAGNGHDTVFLAALVGESGHVDAFDVQEGALASTAARLRETGFLSRVSLHHTGHEHLAEIVLSPVRAVMFNLGWLPGGDKNVTTRWETTEAAVSAALERLMPLGVCTVCVYPGHEAGEVERVELSRFLSALPPQRFNVLHQKFLNAGSNAPECFIIQRMR